MLKDQTKNTKTEQNTHFRRFFFGSCVFLFSLELEEATKQNEMLIQTRIQTTSEQGISSINQIRTRYIY